MWLIVAAQVIAGLAGMGWAFRHARRYPSWRPGAPERVQEPRTAAYSITAAPPRAVAPAARTAALEAAPARKAIER